MSDKRSAVEIHNYTVVANTELYVELPVNVTMVKIRPRTGTILMAMGTGHGNSASPPGPFITLNATDPWFKLDNLTGPRHFWFGGGGGVVEIITLQ